MNRTDNSPQAKETITQTAGLPRSVPPTVDKLNTKVRLVKVFDKYEVEVEKDHRLTGELF